MTDQFEFGTVSGGDWVKGAEHLGEWVLIRTTHADTRTNTFTGESEDVIEADWVFDLLDNGPHTIEKGLMNSGYIARACSKALRRGQELVVARIGQTVPKQKGYQGAFILEQPDVPEMQKAKEKAIAILSAEKESKATPPKARQEPQTDTGEQELQDLLAEM